MYNRLHPFFITMCIGLLGLLAVVVGNDIYRSITRNIPLSYDVVVLLKMAVCAVLGAIAGYLAKDAGNGDEQEE